MKIQLLAIIIAIISACPEDPLCLSCQEIKSFEKSPNTECTYCQYSFYDKKNDLCNKKISQRVDECESYKLVGDQTVCSVCQLGFTLDSEKNQCVKCQIPNCISCNKEQKCNACIGGLIPVEDSSVKTLGHKCSKPDENNQPQPNCLVTHGMEFKNKCFQCANGFALDSMENKKCVKSVNRCYLIDSSNDKKCNVCWSSHFIKEDGTCEKHNSLSYMWIFAIIVPVCSSLFIYAIKSFCMSKDRKNEDEEHGYQKV